ncbi:MAG: glutamate racemase [Anaerolineae bacterium]|nr:glutamate racemase [Anaerolineae bacterium]
MATIGIFDSGLGGLSVWHEIDRLLSGDDLLYLADQAHCPYGHRSADEIRCFSASIAAFLIEQGAQAVVVACNTASAAALHHLRQRFDVPIVGMEPAVKPAAMRTKTGQIGVIATQVTFQGALFASLIERFAQNVTVHTQVCPGLVECVEAGQLDTVETDRLLQKYLRPLLDAGIDTLVLGCTHYPFLRPAIERIVGAQVRIIDPAPAVARQTAHVLHRTDVFDRTIDKPVTCSGQRRFFTSGNPAILAQGLETLIGKQGEIVPAQWVDQRIHINED